MRLEMHQSEREAEIGEKQSVNREDFHQLQNEFLEIDVAA